MEEKQNSEIDQHMWCHLIHDKDYSWKAVEKHSLFDKWFCQLDIHKKNIDFYFVPVVKINLKFIVHLNVTVT